MCAVDTSPSTQDFQASVDALAMSRFEQRLPPLLSVIAGMVDLTGFLSLGNLFTAHITGNLVVIGALAVRGGPMNPAQILAIPVFIVAVAATWWIARASGQRGPSLLRLLLRVQFLLLTGVWAFAVLTTPSAAPHGSMAGIAAMVAVSAMACQFALLRVAIPAAPSTAVMTGNLTNAVLSLLNTITRGEQSNQSSASDLAKLKTSLQLLAGFLGGCVVSTAAVIYLRDWAWLLPAVLSGVAALSV